MTISTDEINILILQYLNETGYKHTAFSFACEIDIKNNPVKREIPPSSLINLVTKGSFYMQLENVSYKCLKDLKYFDNTFEQYRDSLINSLKISKHFCDMSSSLKLFDSEPTPNRNEYILSRYTSLILEGHYKDVIFVEWSFDSLKLATSSIDGVVVIWNLRKIGDKMIFTDETTCLQLDEFKEPITCMKWDNKDYNLIIGSYDGKVYYYSCANNKGYYLDTENPNVPVSLITSSLDNNTFAIVQGNYVNIIDISSHDPKKTKNSFAEDVTNLFVVDSQYIVVNERTINKICKDNTIKQLRKGEEIKDIVCSAINCYYIFIATTELYLYFIPFDELKNIQKIKHTCLLNHILPLDDVSTNCIISSVNGMIEVYYDFTRYNLTPSCLNGNIIDIQINRNLGIIVVIDSSNLVYVFKLEERLDQVASLITFLSHDKLYSLSWSCVYPIVALAVGNGKVAVLDFKKIL